MSSKSKKLAKKSREKIRTHAKKGQTTIAKKVKKVFQ